MKISKIFHSLYAFLMFLPVCAVLGTTLYSILNPNAKDSFSGSVSRSYYERSTTYLPSSFENDKPIDDNYYLPNFSYNDVVNYAFDLDFSFSCYSGGFSFSYTDYSVDDTSGLGSFDVTARLYINLMWTDNEDLSILFGLTDLPGGDITFYCTGIVDFSFYSDTIINFNTDYAGSCPSSFFELAQVPVYSYELVEVEETTLDNAFSYSVNSLYLNPLFSWCNNSFLTEPFHYIGDLFGLPRDNAINTLFSYWLNISIIWLCFDVIMYVPLLCHRWIDKGGLE